MSRTVTIAGGGLAGLGLALRLAREGLPVRVLEAGHYPRHRVCGEFLAGLTPEFAADAGLRPLLGEAVRHDEVIWFRHDRQVRIHRLPRPVYGLSRHRLDQFLAEAVTAAGGAVETGVRHPGPAAAEGLVWAAGRLSARPAWVGLKIHLRNAAQFPASGLEVHLGDGAYAGLSAVEGGRANLCGLFRLRRDLRSGKGTILQDYLRASGLHALARRLAEGDADPESFCAVAALGFGPPGARDGRLALGDAFGLIPPFTGNGMTLALETAGLAAPPVAAWARGEYSWAAARRTVGRRLQRRLRSRFRIARILHPWLLRPRLQAPLARLAGFGLLPFQPLYHLLH
ncbi:MAG: hypothetical protein EA425_08155 [Puniceicoccaceae bacterium]|nr:MAG: hypothetical protein EA425_08155 [Puniceicoccaceae bacterium]